MISPVVVSLSLECMFSAYGSNWSVAEKTIVITGASDGIGHAACSTLARAGARVVMVGRNEAKTAQAARRIMGTTGSRQISWFIGDLSRQAVVHEVAGALRAAHPVIDVLINNAGALFMNREVTPDGFERTFALNHLAYFTLASLLLPSLSASTTTAQVINVSSRAHVRAQWDSNNLNMNGRYRGWRAYANSKLANILFTRALAERVNPAMVAVQALHPGVVSTRFAANNGARGRLLRRIMDVGSISPEAGADTMVWLAGADAPQLGSGSYWVKRAAVNPSRQAQRVAFADELWETSKQFTTVDTDAIIDHANIGRRV